MSNMKKIFLPIVASKIWRFDIFEFSNFRRRIKKLTDYMLFGLVMQNVKFVFLYLLSLLRYGGSNFDILDGELRNSQIICYLGF